MEEDTVNISDLPGEIIDHIFTFLFDDDFIRMINVSHAFRDSVERLMFRGRKLDFGGRYRLKEESLVSFITQYDFVKKRLNHINFNQCHWLNSSLYDAVVQLENLRHLHVIDCKLSSQVIHTILGLQLTSLSISWTQMWLMHLENTRRRIFLSSSRHYPPLFSSLRHLVIYIPYKSIRPGNSHLDFIVDIRTNLLKYCYGLESLEMFDLPDEEPPKLAEITYRGVPFDELPDVHFLPNLRSLVLNLESIYSELVEFVLRIIKRKPQLLDEIYLGDASFLMLEGDEELASRIVPYISANKIPTICLDYFTGRCSTSIKNNELLIWKDRATPNCKMFSLSNVNFQENSTFFESLATKCPSLSCLHLQTCYIFGENLYFGLRTVANLCSQLTALVLTVVLIDNTTNIRFYKIIGEFRALKLLHLVDEMLVCDEAHVNIDTRPISRMNAHELENAMRQCPLYELTESCKDIEEFRIWEWNNFAFPDVMLACISNWSKLKYLHLDLQLSAGDQDFLLLITQRCRQLSTLTITQPIDLPSECYFLEAFKYAKSLKDLRVFASFTLSSEMCESLGHCVNLERLYADRISLPLVPDNCIEKLLEKLPKLMAVCFASSFGGNEKVTEKLFQQELHKLQKNRPAFYYNWNNEVIFPVVYRQMQMNYLNG